MFSEILKIIPRLETKDLANMERVLNSRFMRVAKKFGGGIMSVLKGGGIAGAGLALIDKLINPLKETQEAIDRTLKASDDLATNAKQFNTTAGRLAKLQAFGKSAGLDADSLAMLITKFQTSVAEAKADPNKATSVRNFVGEEDTAAAFFEFIQALQKMDKTQQLLVQQEVFGEKQILKMADFLNSDFANVGKYFAKFNSATLTKDINKTGDLNDLNDTLAAVRELEDLSKKSKLINEGMITSRDRAERVALDRENQRIASYQNLQAISTTVDKIAGLIEQGVAQIGKFITFATPMINRLVESISKLSNSRLLKGFFGGGD